MIELWPAAPGDSADRPLLKLRSLAAERDGEDRVVVVYLPEARRLVAALELAEAETRHAKRDPA